MLYDQADEVLARHHIREVELRITELKARISNLKEQGRPTDLAEDLLASFEKSLDLLTIHLSRVIAASNPTSKGG
jgi:hypothetical protein